MRALRVLAAPTADGFRLFTVDLPSFLWSERCRSLIKYQILR